MFPSIKLKSRTLFPLSPRNHYSCSTSPPLTSPCTLLEIHHLVARNREMRIKESTTTGPESDQDSPTSEAESEICRANVTLYRWKETLEEWADVGPGRAVILELESARQPGVFHHQLVFRNSGNFKVRSRHRILPGECRVSAEFPGGVEVAVGAELALKFGDAPAPPARLCFVFEDEADGNEDRRTQLAQEFTCRYRASQEFTAGTGKERTLRMLPDLVRQGVIKPGKGVVGYTPDGGEEVMADLQAGGGIGHGGRTFVTLSAFVHAVKTERNPGKYISLENGWAVTEYQGRRMVELRREAAVAQSCD